jgi:hypothetical protein
MRAATLDRHRVPWHIWVKIMADDSRLCRYPGEDWRRLLLKGGMKMVPFPVEQSVDAAKEFCTVVHVNS